MKALPIGIYKNKGKDYSNGGISSRYDEILLECEDGFVDVTGEEENLCRLDSVRYGEHTHYHVRPVADPTAIGWMAGGTVVFSSDSRFPFAYPLSLHDRQESQELNDMLSR